MIPLSEKLPPAIFDPAAIEEQLGIIFKDPNFADSEILKNFLSFIVRETLNGHSNLLKEYTIGLKVLGKPVDFKPQENGIVRIHAGRLRRTLDRYYKGSGSRDMIIISIPKGKYIPEFKNREDVCEDALDDTAGDITTGVLSKESLSIAVLPFTCLSDSNEVKFMAEGLGAQVSSMLMKNRSVSVVAYEAVKNLSALYHDYRQLGAAAGFDHVITGSIQYSQRKLRVNIHVVITTTYRQILSEVYEKKLSRSNFFDIQDEISMIIAKRVKELALNRNSSRVNEPMPVLSAVV